MNIKSHLILTDIEELRHFVESKLIQFTHNVRQHSFDMLLKINYLKYAEITIINYITLKHRYFRCRFCTS